MTDDEFAQLEAVRSDLQDEEADQQAERGYASPRLLRAIARLDQMLPDRADLHLPR